MRRRKTCTSLTPSLLFLSLIPPAAADSPEPMPFAERRTLSSKVLGEDREVLVSTPQGYGTGQKSYPVLYLTDGDAHLLHTAGTVGFLATNGLIPELIIVGIPNTDRNRDLSPTRATITRDDGTVMEFPTSGGAEEFLEFISTELMPFVEKSYRTQPFKILAGHSLGGLFSTYTFVSQPDLFQAYIAVSPALSWDDQLALKLAEELFADRKKLNKTYFMTLGDEPGQMEEAWNGLRTLLADTKIDGFAWGARQMKDENHGSVVLRSHYFGLQKVFEDWQLPRDPETGEVPGGLDAVVAHYQGISEKYGFSITPPEQIINGLGYQAMGRGDLAVAIEIFRYNVAGNPHSANPHDSLAEALENDGRLEEARKGYEMAYELGQQIEDPNAGVYKRNLDRVLAKQQEGAGAGES
ncbi:MAG: hypothetical protein GY769_16995 [bacterium]|nr:hypothetical protein [bacterium]